MNPTTELETLFRLIAHITECYAAEADAKFFLKKRRVEITVDEGGKRLFSKTLNIDSFTIEDDAKEIRHELEQMIEDCELPILHMEVAA